MTRRRSTRNPVRVRAVQFSSRLVGTYGCGQVRHDSGRVRPARFLACGRATAQIGPENSAGCGSGSMFGSECHALLPTHRLPTTDCTDYSKYQLPPTNYKYLRTYPSTAMYNVLTTNPSTTSVPTHRLPTTDYIPIDDRLLTTDYQLPTD